MSLTILKYDDLYFTKYVLVSAALLTLDEAKWSGYAQTLVELLIVNCYFMTQDQLFFVF